MNVRASFPSAVVLAGIVAVSACSGDDPAGGTSQCDWNGSCPNRKPSTPSEKSRCQTALADPKCGADYQALLNCSLPQEKCTPEGVTDDAATRAAITQNCGRLVAAFQSCSGTGPATPQCGLTGLACCTDGSPPCASTACCDTATHECRGLGEACTAAGTVCSANQCGPCGAPGQPCCQIYGMTQPNPCPSGGCCNYSAGEMGGTCIAEGGQCEASGPNTTEMVCHSGSCITCGSELGTCCAGNKCANPSNVCSGTTCMP